MTSVSKFDRIQFIQAHGINCGIQFMMGEHAIKIGYHPQRGKQMAFVQDSKSHVVTAQFVQEWLGRFSADQSYRRIQFMMGKIRPVAYGRVVDTCSVDGCSRPVDYRVADYCKRHNLPVECYAHQKGYAKRPVRVLSEATESEVTREVSSGAKDESAKPKRTTYRCLHCNRRITKRIHQEHGGHCVQCAMLEV